MTRKHHYQNYFTKGWSFEDVLPYFLRAEGYQEPLHNRSKAKEKQHYYGRNGELPIRDSLHLSPLAKLFQKLLSHTKSNMFSTPNQNVQKTSPRVNHEGSSLANMLIPTGG